ncbi:MAG TPA: ATP-binding cassette domain-containing protein [bacterium]|nr:ATP-binding cassette domain-containing protein [bacterium]
MLEFVDASLSFGGKALFSGLNLRIKRGEKAVFTGKSGTGKTSIMNMILGFQRPGTGLVKYNGRPINDKTAWEVRKNTAYVSQDIYIGNGTAGDVIDEIFSYRANAGVRPSPKEKGEALGVFRLRPEILEKNLNECSGGEKQRLALAAALLLKRGLFLLDEPTSALDDGLKKKIAGFFINNPGYTCVIASHDSAWLRTKKAKIIRVGK